MAGTGARLTLLFVPLIVVAIHSAPAWPARAQMWEGAGRDTLLEVTQAWATAVCAGTQQRWCGPQGPLPEPTPIIRSTETYEVAARSTLPIAGKKNADPAENKSNHDITSVAVASTNTSSVLKHTGSPSTAALAAGTVLMVGDSLMTGVATGLRGELPPQYKIVDRAKPSTGLCNREYFDWPLTAGSVAQELQPDWVIIHLGGNDGQDILHEGRWLRFGSPAWIEQYRTRAERMIQNIQAAAPRATIAWVGLPAMRPGKYADKSQQIEQLHRQAAQRSGIAYIDGKAAMGSTYQKSGPGPDGRVTVLRNEDGIHYSRAGGGVLGQALGRQMNWPIKHP